MYRACPAAIMPSQSGTASRWTFRRSAPSAAENAQSSAPLRVGYQHVGQHAGDREGVACRHFVRLRVVAVDHAMLDHLARGGANGNKVDASVEVGRASGGQVSQTVLDQNASVQRPG